MKYPAPPQPLLRLLKWFCKPEYHADIEGDLLEFYERRVNASGRTKANWLLLRDVLLLFRPGIVRPIVACQNITNHNMVGSHFKIGWRSLLKNKLYSAINIIGLTFGIVCFLLIGLYVFDELTFDHQHVNRDRIYRLVQHRSVNGEATTIAAGGFKLAEESKNAIPEVENTTRLLRARANLVDPENPVNFQETVTIADENFLTIFDFPLIEGDRRTALKEPNTMVINEDLAIRIFNRTDVVGKLLQFGQAPAPMVITGILKNHPCNSSFTFNSLMSESTYYSEDFFKQAMESDWTSDDFTVYAVLRPKSDPTEVSQKMTNLVLSNFSLPAGSSLSYSLQRLTDVHLYSENIVDGGRNTNVESIATGNPIYIKLFSFIALFVLIIAGINYTNLTTARASSRVKEIGVRKTIGAISRNLVSQFLIESLLTTIIAFMLAVVVVYLMLPPFNEFVSKQLSLGESTAVQFWLAAFALVVLVGLLSGSYVALLLSRFNPVTLLKGQKVRHNRDMSIRKGLVIFQFTISTVMIIGTIVLLLQVRYLSNTDLGFNKDLMVVIDVNVQKARTNFEAVKNEMSKIPSVKSVSVTSRVPGEWKMFRKLKIRSEGSTNDYQLSYMLGADQDFLATYDIRLLRGRNFNGAHDSLSVLINETAARMLNITDASSQTIDIGALSHTEGSFTPINNGNIQYLPRVVGIVKDFHFQSLRDKIQPLVIAYNDNPLHVIDYYSVRIASASIQKTLDQLKAIMVKNDESEPFEYHFLDDQLALFYVEDERRQTILTWVALASVFIACLGLFGLATYSAEQRFKEIAVRKVLGANVIGLTSLLSKEFIKLVLIANCIAFPIAWWGANKWLQEYAYHIDVSWWVFAVAALLATGTAMLTVGYQAIKAAVVNPVKMLRSE